MDASCKIQGSIHSFRLVYNMCPELWVHIKMKRALFCAWLGLHQSLCQEDSPLRANFCENACGVLVHGLDQSLCHHCTGYLEEAVDVCAGDVVGFCGVLGRGLVGVVVDVGHNLLQLCINFLASP